MSESTFSRRDFLRVAAGAAAVAATGGACGSGSDKTGPSGAAKTKSGGEQTLRVAQWGHFVPAYDQWFDNDYTRSWGEEHGIEVVVDHIPAAQLPSRADAEVAAERGHDIFGFISPRPALEDEVIDHREIIEAIEVKLGKMSPLVERSILNPRTNKYFGFSDYWVANTIHYRVDLWDQVQPGFTPGTWDDLVRAGPKLKAMGYPLGLGISQDLDSTFSLLALMHAYGASIQDEEGNVTINSPASVEAVKVMAALQGGMTDEVFAWDLSSNNRLLASGKGSLILNAISAIRAVEDQDPDLAGKISLAPTPTAGPNLQQVTGAYVTGVYVIWKFARNQEAAKQFLVDLALNYREAFTRSGFYNLPTFPDAVPDLGELVANDASVKPPDKYALLAEAAKWSTNVGHPGHTNAAVDEVVNRFLVPQMFAAAVRGEMTAEDSVRAAEAQMKPIFEKWREQGKI